MRVTHCIGRIGTLYEACVRPGDRFMVQMAQVYKRPIWVTEFACGLQPNIQSLTTIMKQFLTMLDRQPQVARRVQRLFGLGFRVSLQGSPGCKLLTCTKARAQRTAAPLAPS